MWMADSEGAEEPQAVAPLSVKAFVLLLWIRNFAHLHSNFIFVWRGHGGV